jgi:hypothetical protein
MSTLFLKNAHQEIEMSCEKGPSNYWDLHAG